jgi:hypothetical protein
MQADGMLHTGHGTRAAAGLLFHDLSSLCLPHYSIDAGFGQTSLLLGQDAVSAAVAIMTSLRARPGPQAGACKRAPDQGRQPGLPLQCVALASILREAVRLHQKL